MRRNAIFENVTNAVRDFIHPSFISFASAYSFEFYYIPSGITVKTNPIAKVRFERNKTIPDTIKAQ
jgi:hypothetical protein